MSHLTLTQRYQIGALRHLKPAQIAQRIGKHRSVVTRELARNAKSIAEYQPQTAHKAYQQRHAKTPFEPRQLSTRRFKQAFISTGLLNRFKADASKQASGCSPAVP